MTHGVNDFFDFATATVPADALGSVHFLAIGGSGMSGVAQLLHDQGVPVSGCDGAASPAVQRLQSAGVPVRVGHDPGHLSDVDTLVARIINMLWDGMAPCASVAKPTGNTP